MKTFLKVGLNAIMAMVLCTSCGGPGGGNDANDADSTAIKEAPLLPPSGIEAPQMFKTTGEVIVFFKPGEARLKTLRKENNNIDQELKDFEQFVRLAKTKASSTGRLVLESDENDVKLKVTEDQVNYINTLGVKAGYGVVFARHKKSPWIIQGAISMEDFEKQLSDYYK